MPAAVLRRRARTQKSVAEATGGGAEIVKMSVAVAR
jgi:hypothetical protein